MDFKTNHHRLYDGTIIYIVDGNYVRNNICIGAENQFIQGGHGYVYNYIPKDEIWIEKMLSDEDQNRNMAHEIIEYFLMKYCCFDYNTAHDHSLRAEEALRVKNES